MSERKWNAADLYRHTAGRGELAPARKTFVMDQERIIVTETGALAFPDCPDGLDIEGEVALVQLGGQMSGSVKFLKLVREHEQIGHGGHRMLRQRLNILPQLRAELRGEGDMYAIPLLERVKRRTQAAIIEIGQRIERGDEKKKRHNRVRLVPQLDESWGSALNKLDVVLAARDGIGVNGRGGALGVYTEDRRNRQHLRLPQSWLTKVYDPGWAIIHGTLILDILGSKVRFPKLYQKNPPKPSPTHVLALRPVGRSKLEAQAWIAEVRYRKEAPPKLWWLRQDDCPHGVSGHIIRCDQCCEQRQMHTANTVRSPDNLLFEHRANGGTMHDKKPRAECPACEGRAT